MRSAATPSASSLAASSPSISMARAIPHSPEALAAMSPMELFVSQLSCDLSLEARVDAMHRLPIVAFAMGCDATLTQLIPYLAGNILSDAPSSSTSNAALDSNSSHSKKSPRVEEDEVLLLLGEGLGHMVPHLIPGPKALPLLPVLEKLASVEETVVRDKAVESIVKIVPLLYPQQPTVSSDKNVAAAAMFLLAMVKRLAGADWFTSKVSVTGILPAVYGFIDLVYPQQNSTKVTVDPSVNGTNSSTPTAGDEARRELRQLYKELSEDDSPMVRRSAAKSVGSFVERVAGLKSSLQNILNIPKSPIQVSPIRKKTCLEEIFPFYQQLCKDEQDNVRMLAIASSGSIGRALGMDATVNADLLLPIIRCGCSDLSWRVRHHLAKDFNKVSSGLGFHLHPVASFRLTDLFQCYAALLQDIEAEVRTAAVSNVAHMTFLGGSDLFLEHIAPRLRAIAADPVMEVRSKLAQTMMDCVGSDDAEDGLGSRPLSDSVILQVFKPLLEGFLSDEFAEVQLHVLNKLSRVSHLLGKMDAVVNAILAMTKAHNWRVRESVARLLPHLADALGVVFFKENLIEPWLKLLLDQVSQVRLACVTGMAHLLKVAGEQWIQKEIMPHYQTIYEEGAENYLTRMTILRCVVTLCEAQRECRTGSSSNSLQEEILGILLVAIDDSVANVRIIASQGLGLLANSCFEEAVVSAKIRPALEERLNDGDEDCRYFSQLALNSISSSR